MSQPRLTQRERFLDVLRFRTTDRIPFEPGGPRRSTLARWYDEGLPREGYWHDHLVDRLGLPRDCGSGSSALPISTRCLPHFEEKVLEHRDGHYVVQDWMGNVVEISDRYDLTYLRSGIDLVTRRWLRFPVNTPGEFAAIQERYRPDDAGRYPADWDAQVARLRSRTHPTTLAVPGPFWQMRDWVGFEPLCELFMNDPGFIDEMVGFWQRFVLAVMERAMRDRVVDHLLISEDMAYKEKPMISPAMARRHLAPCWSAWAERAKAGGVEVVEVDSDGRVDLLMPEWIRCGIQAASPYEVAAGTDLPALRRRFGTQLAFRGGVDKRLMAKGGRHIEAELARLEPVIRDGGYIPACDHGVPNDVSWPDFLHYAGRLAQITGWA